MKRHVKRWLKRTIKRLTPSPLRKYLSRRAVARWREEVRMTGWIQIIKPKARRDYFPLSHRDRRRWGYESRHRWEPRHRIS